MAQQAKVEAASITHKHQKTPGLLLYPLHPTPTQRFVFGTHLRSQRHVPMRRPLRAHLPLSLMWVPPAFPNSPGIKTTGSSLGACRPRFQPHSVTLLPQSGHQAVAHHVVPKTLHGKAAHATQIFPFHACRTQVGCSWDLMRGSGAPGLILFPALSAEGLSPGEGMGIPRNGRGWKTLKNTTG